MASSLADAALAAHRLTGDVLQPGAVALGQIAGAALRLLDQAPELALFFLSQVVLDALASFRAEPQHDRPDHPPRDPLPDSGHGAAGNPKGHLCLPRRDASRASACP